MTPNTDNRLSSLWEGCLKNDRKQQEALYKLLAPKMLTVCLRYAKDKDEAQDILQEGFIKMFNNLERYRQEGEFGAWLRKIMVNTSINYLKKNTRYNAELVFNDMDLAPVITDIGSDNPETTLNSKQMLSLVRQLPAGYQAIFNLHAIEGYSHVEIGGVLGISDATSRTQFFKARKLLRKWITEMETPNAKLNNDAG